MKYDSRTKVLAFSSDANVSTFHDQLTELMRFAMSKVGSVEIGEDEVMKLTLEFFDRYSVLSDVLRCLRAHLPRGDVR